MPLISKLFCVRRAPLTETLASCGPGPCCRAESAKGARRERENLREVARGERQLRDRARVNDAAKLRAVRFWMSGTQCDVCLFAIPRPRVRR